MSFTNIMFYSGSILHELDLPVEADFSAQVYDKIVEELAPNYLLANYANQEARDEALALAAASAMANSDAAKYTKALNEVLTDYCYRDYLQCVHDWLKDIFAVMPWCYLMYQHKNVLKHGITPFHFYAPPDIIRIGSRDGAQEIADKLKKGTLIGKFARTASVANADNFELLGITKEAKFLKRTVRGKDEYNVINAADPVPGDWNAIHVDGRPKVGNTSSRVIKADMDAFVGNMREANLGFPVFSVSDCNSFHTSGYLWATYAIRSVMKAGDDAPVAILNFDQHIDIGATGDSDILASDGWGGPALATVKNGLYMSFGNAITGKVTGLNKEYNWPNSLVVRKNDVSTTLKINTARERTAGKHYTGTNEVPGMTAEEKLWYVAGVIGKLKARWNVVVGKPREASLTSLAHGASNQQGMAQADGFPRIDQLDLGAIFTEFWKCLSAYLGHTIKYVFITVDRDAVQKHQTQWGDQSFFPNAYSLYYAISTITDSLLALYGDCKLIGIDITGLPESRVAYRHRVSELVPAAEAWDEAAEEIKLLHAWGNAHVVRRWRDKVSNAFVDKAVIIFSNLHRDVGGKTLKRFLSSGTIAAINKLWLKVEKLQARPDSLLKHTMFEAEMREAMAGIASGLRTGAGKMFMTDHISKEAKNTLLAYANRIDSLLDPPVEQPRLLRTRSLV
jgi:hypothetical protein